MGAEVVETTAATTESPLTTVTPATIVEITRRASPGR
jgi:hypothetical protein